MIADAALYSGDLLGYIYIYVVRYYLYSIIYYTGTGVHIRVLVFIVLYKLAVTVVQ